MKRSLGAGWAIVVAGVLACKGGTGASAAAEPPAPAPAPPSLAGTRPAYDFLANRVHAVVHREGRLVIPAGDASFLKYIDGGWKTSWFANEKDAGKRVAYVNGLSATLFVPIDTDGDGAGGQALGDLKLRLFMRGLAPGQRLSVFANEKPAGTIEVSPTHAAHEVTLPAAALSPGENRIRLTFRGAGAISGGRRAAAAIERIELGAAGGSSAEGALVEDVELGGARKRAFVATSASRLSFYVAVPPAAKLALAYGAPQAGATVVVRVAKDGAAPAVLFEGPASPRWTEAAWDLSAYADEPVRIDLVSRGGGALWAAPRLVVKAPEAVTIAPKKFDRIFIWMVDTLRADKVGVYNPKTIVKTPNYDAFAADSTRFAWAQVPGTWSLPSHASILTGVYPSVHGATAHEARLSTAVPFVAELMKKAGYRTAMFSSNGYVSGKWGFDRGWDINRNFIRESLPNGADYLWKQAKTWIVANGKKKQFAYLATVEPHVIYNPKKEYLAKYWKKPYRGPIKPNITGLQLGYIKTGKLKVNDTDKAYLEALHNAEITQSDDLFAAFIADLKSAGLYDSSVVVVISDHGDEFWDHGDVGHAQSVHQELVHIPLMIHAPGLFPPGRVVRADVEAMDLFPTLLDLAGLPTPEATQGSSLVPLASDETDLYPGMAWSQNLGVSRGVKVGSFRLIHAGAAKMELYDEVKDPREQDNQVAKRPVALRQMRNVFGLIAAYENRWKKRQWGTAANVAEAFYAKPGS